MGEEGSQPEIRLVYYDIRGFGEPLRWMFKIAGVDFVDERIPLDAWANKRKRSSLGEPRPRDRESKRKSSDSSATLLRFKRFIGQLPILFFGDDFVLTQTLTVMRFIARKYGLNGETELEEARADEVSDLVVDLRMKAVDYEGKAFQSATKDIVRHTVFRDFNNSPDTPEKQKMKEDFTTMYFPLYFQKFADLLQSGGGEYIAGKSLTYGDLVLANFLEICEDLVDPNCLVEFPTLRALKSKIFAIPAIEQWRSEQKVNTIETGYPEVG